MMSMRLIFVACVTFGGWWCGCGCCCCCRRLPPSARLSSHFALWMVALSLNYVCVMCVYMYLYRIGRMEWLIRRAFYVCKSVHYEFWFCARFSLACRLLVWYCVCDSSLSRSSLSTPPTLRVLCVCGFGLLFLSKPTTYYKYKCFGINYYYYYHWLIVRACVWVCVLCVVWVCGPFSAYSMSFSLSMSVWVCARLFISAITIFMVWLFLSS